MNKYGRKKKDSDSDNDFDFGDDDDITESKESSQPSIEKKLQSFSRSSEKLDVDDVIKKLLTNKVRNIGLSGEVSEDQIIKIIEAARDIVT